MEGTEKWHIEDRTSRFRKTTTRSSRPTGQGSRSTISCARCWNTQSVPPKTMPREAGLKKRREAIAWVVNEDRSHLFTFESVCETLGINARWLRAKLELVKGETAIQIDREEVALAPTGEPPQLEDRSTREIGYSGGSGPPE